MRPLLLLLGVALLAGCSSRRIAITSEPTGALVTVNDVEVGRTPVEAEFTYYGVYDVRVEAKGFEPLRTRARANAPFYEYPPVDFIASTTPPAKDTVIRWHFRLEPSLESTLGSEEFERTLLERARTLRGKVDTK
ncbi:MAG: PEGA domain-containing protein [Phycisphaerales bacterium]|nr:PEGA domain-containing protein [Phycisphaerales bacterium]